MAAVEKLQGVIQAAQNEMAAAQEAADKYMTNPPAPYLPGWHVLLDEEERLTVTVQLSCPVECWLSHRNQERNTKENLLSELDPICISPTGGNNSASVMIIAVISQS